ncbi:MAG: acyl-CoA synthetase [Acidobacteria bacterium RIFCSPLOWO2_12_FULL_54_10]|nr:MAG: acyl-CoA synthetase [Acidobacteria bacterium RIFCSPLOWO2_12_FULL_54_10]
MQKNENPQACAPNMQNYEEAYRVFKLDVPEFYNFGLDTVDRWAEDPAKLALYWIGDNGTEKQITFAEIKELSDRFAKALLASGLRKGDRVLLVMGRVPEWFVSLLGMLKAGVVAVPGTTQLAPKDILYRFHAAHCKAAVVGSDIVPRVDSVREQCPELKLLVCLGTAPAPWRQFETFLSSGDPQLKLDRTKSSDDALVYFSSGTTGNPKMVLHTHASYPLGHDLTGRFWLDLRPEDLHWNLSDTGWAKAAWSSFFGPWSQGACIFVAQMSGKFQPAQVLGMLQKYPITTLCAPPTALRVIVQENLKEYRFPCLRHCVSAGEPLNPEVMEIWKQATGLTLYDGYGQTETVCLIGNFRCLPVKPGAMGKPMPGFDIGIIDDDGNELPVGKEGHIAVRTKPNRPIGLFQEYLAAPDLNATAFRGDWYITGDRAVRDSEGYLWFVGRADDVIITAGYRVGPFEVESALIEHPAVVEAAAVAKPEAIRGHIIKAYVVLAPDYKPSEELVRELQEHVKSLTAPYKYPREIEFLKELPKTISGKILRRELRDRAAAHHDN